MNSYHYTDIDVGMVEQFEVLITEKMMRDFSNITGDYNPLHCDEEFAVSQGFKSNVVYGMLTSSFYSTLAGMYLPGKWCLIHSVETKMLNPVYIGEKLLIEGKVAEKNDTFKLLTIKVTIKNQSGEKVSRGVIKAGVRDAE